MLPVSLHSGGHSLCPRICELCQHHEMPESGLPSNGGKGLHFSPVDNRCSCNQVLDRVRLDFEFAVLSSGKNMYDTKSESTFSEDSSTLMFQTMPSSSTVKPISLAKSV